jgi:hypothetical protein
MNREPAEKHSAGFWFVQMNLQNLCFPAEVVTVSPPRGEPSATLYRQPQLLS